MKKIVWVLALLFLPVSAFAHKPSDSYLFLNASAGSLHGNWDIAVKDLEVAVGLDSDANSNVTWGELKAGEQAIKQYASQHLSIKQGEMPCSLSFQSQTVINHTDGAYSSLPFTLDCPSKSGAITITYSLLFEFDPFHRGLLSFSTGSNIEVRVFSPQEQHQTFELSNLTVEGNASTGIWKEIKQFFVEGVWHIWLGFDHILFLMALLLGSIVGTERRNILPNIRSSAVSILKVVTAFTLAHSITLSLAVLRIVSIPSQIVESLIAASVFLAALNLLLRVVDERKLWMVAFFFGLIHGFGFASVLLDMGLPTASLAAALASFNIGVEAGQLVLVSIFLSITFLVRKTAWFDMVVVRGGSVAILFISGFWFCQRAFNL